MDLLYRARQASGRRTPITQLLASAVRDTYGHLAVQQSAVNTELKEAA